MLPLYFHDQMIVMSDFEDRLNNEKASKQYQGKADYQKGDKEGYNMNYFIKF